jgi:hypothetical protein
MRRRDAKALVGPDWLTSDARIEWETRIMRRRVPLYKATIKALQLLNKLSRGPRPSMRVTYWERVGPGGGTFMMPKLETMTGRTDDPVTSARELHARTSFASRLARTISADEWPQIIEEYERRRRGEAPRFHYVGHRPLNLASHALMDKAWVNGELPTDAYRIWNGEVKLKDLPGLYSEFYTHGGSRSIPGGETNPAYRLVRLLHDVNWRAKASMANELRVLRKARVLRAQQVVKFVAAEAKYVVTGGRTDQPAATNAPEAHTPDVIAAVADFVKPPDVRSRTARGETEPDRIQANANDLANTVARSLPPPIVRRGSGAARPGDASRPGSQGHQSQVEQRPGPRPAGHPPTPPGRSRV